MEGEKQILELCQSLANNGRLDELNQAVKDRGKLIELLKEYSLSEDREEVEDGI